MSQFAGQYRQFFDSPAGIEFLTTVNGLLDSNHRNAEKNPDLARDYMQRAKGNREVLEHIQTVTMERSTPKQKIVTS